MIVGPIVIRLMYELLMMAVLLLKNVISINNKLRNQNENGEKNSVFAVPDMSSLRQQFQPKTAQPQSPHCGAAGLDERLHRRLLPPGQHRYAGRGSL